jgi:NADH-quinone oxidoreductase subunit F
MTGMPNIEALEGYREDLRRSVDPKKPCVRICMTGCRAYGALEIRDAFLDEIRSHGIEHQVNLRETGCHGFCAKAPVMAVDPKGLVYQEVQPADVRDIVETTLLKGGVVDRLLYQDPSSGERYLTVDQIPYYKKQHRRVLKLCGRIDPKRIDDYLLHDGYRALTSILEEGSPEQVIEEVERSGLRGRGGAGFPTGRKWRITRQARGDCKYLVCNADEGDPGAFMDRAVLEGDPHSVVEGMLIGAYAMGAAEGYIYVRAEYPIAVEHLRIAVRQAEELGLLGRDILGTGFAFDLHIKEGAGAFVCGEETALMASIEGRRGMPRSRPPFPAQSGLWGKPTCINNVETLANIPTIFLNGAESYAAVGTDRSKGTKIFSLAGKVNNTGLMEVPIGISMREVIYDIGGGIPKERRFKAVQMGGPSGGCVPANYLDLTIDYDSLQAIGAIMGSGGMVVMDENNCMVDIARFFLSFTQSESCGKCSPCRLGTKQMLEILNRITRGAGRPGDIERLIEIGQAVRRSSLCGLGQNCANPVLSTIRYFRDEYEAHIRERKCPAASCDAMIISACQHACPAGVDVPNYVAAIAEGDYIKAVDIIREKNPFPAVCGRICIHPCEGKCRRGELDEPVSIRALKRFASDRFYERMPESPEPFPVTREERVAIVGAGPSGLTCAFFLAKMGYSVTVFEGKDVAGGMLRLAVPEFRLPKRIIDEDVRFIESCGVEIRYNSPIGVKHTVQDLLKEGFAAVFIAAGALASKAAGIPGEERRLQGLLYGLQFLMEIKQDREVDVGKRVLVIGGGNVAVDVARTARRLGAAEVRMVCLEQRREMPAWEKEVCEALDEGVQLVNGWGPQEILNDNGRVAGVRFMSCTSVFDMEGRFRPTFNPEVTRTWSADSVIISIGQAPDLSFLSEDTQLERAVWGTLQVEENRLTTNVTGIFAGGDFVTGPTYVIRAIASGRRAAIAIDKYLRRDDSPVTLLDEKTALGVISSRLSAEEESVPLTGRLPITMTSAGERVSDFREVEIGYEEQHACQEARRCLRCDLEED